jgi:hypothetical protein
MLNARAYLENIRQFDWFGIIFVTLALCLVVLAFLWVYYSGTQGAERIAITILPAQVSACITIYSLFERIQIRKPRIHVLRYNPSQESISATIYIQNLSTWAPLEVKTVSIQGEAAISLPEQASIQVSSGREFKVDLPINQGTAPKSIPVLTVQVRQGNKNSVLKKPLRSQVNA